MDYCDFKSSLTIAVFLSDLGVHIDGFIAAVAFTIVVGATKVCIPFINHFIICCHDWSQNALFLYQSSKEHCK